MSLKVSETKAGHLCCLSLLTISGTGQSWPVFLIHPDQTISEVVAASTQSGNLKTAIGGWYADLQ
jgi:hypothetical protein